NTFMFDWKIVSGLATLYRFVKEILQDIRPNAKESVIAATVVHNKDDSNDLNERYQVTLGRRHKFLREKILHLNPREMSDFYGFEKVSFLEDCESGIDEFPTDSIKRLIETFFIQSQYIQEGKYTIFQKFDIISSKDDCKKFLCDGFRPQFLCDPDFQNTGFVYLTFSKKEQEVWRTISSNTTGSFHSNGGGAWNIYHFIYAMLDIHYDSYISFVDVTTEEWKRLDDGSWYNNKGMLGYSGKANHKASDIFDEWVGIVKKSLEEKY
ncbi:MAG: hypothetical protein AAGF26_12675, partial [Cyanobacteria bacterium P01_G01_bin.49]